MTKKIIMFKKEKNKILIVILTLVVLSLIAFFVSKNTPVTGNFSAPEFTKEAQKTNKIFLEINQEKYDSEVSNTLSVYDFMDKLRNEGKITFEEKTFAGIGKFIDEINGLKNSNEKYWIYYVNKQEAQVGVSDYLVNAGDVISWEYKDSIY